MALSEITNNQVAPSGMPSKSVLQVVNVKSSAAQSTTSSTFQDTALTASITPSSTSSKILILANVSMYSSSGIFRSYTLSLDRKS